MYIDIDILHLILTLCSILAYLSIVNNGRIFQPIQVANPIFLINKIQIQNYLNLTGLTIRNKFGTARWNWRCFAKENSIGTALFTVVG